MIKQEDTGYSVTATIKQVRILIEDVTDLTMTDSLTDSGFTGIRLSGCETPGVIWVEGRLLNPNYLSLRLGLVHIDEKSQKNKISSFLDQLEKAGILERTDNDVTTRFNVSCEPMGPIRADQLKGKLVRLNDIASFLQKETNPLCGFRFNEIAEKYNGMSELLEGVMPIEKKFNIPESNWRKKVSEAITCLKAGICVATVFESRLLGTMFLRSIAACLLEAGETIGKYKGTSIVIKNLPDLISKAPGFVAMSAVSLSFSTSPYERADEIDALFELLNTTDKALLFYGSRNQHSVFGSGQGRKGNPINPLLINILKEDLPVEFLADFALSVHCNDMSISGKEKTRKELIEYLVDNATNDRYLDLIEPHLRNLNNGGDPGFLTIIRDKKESFRSMPLVNRFHRDSDLRQKLISSLETGNLREYLGSNIISQESALDELISRMWADILSRKTHQPMLQLLLQGIAGVGKSEVSRLIAGYFGIPYISIDTASFTSHHEASSMILGSGRGIVQSYLPGKLELAANNHNGCLVEVSDLDHCHPGTRSFFADLFLHILENGYAQSGSGELISCTNLLIIFTINLPGGRDEQALRSLGFNNTPDLQSIKKNIRKEIKNLFSAAFLSRLGNPILFFPIREDALPALLEMALKNSLRTSFLNLGAPSCDISIVPGTAEALLSANYQPEASSGARGVYELARNLVTQEVSKMLGPLRTRGITQSVISMGSDKTLNITLK